MMMQVILQDLTEVRADAIVNSANRDLVRGRDLSASIFRKAGREMEKETRKQAPLEPGQAIMTRGYGLGIDYVIHTVPPLYGPDQEDRLRDCYRNSLRLADQQGLETVAFPALGTGNSLWPRELALRIAVEEVKKYLNFENENLRKLYFACNGNERLKASYEELIRTTKVI